MLAFLDFIDPIARVLYIVLGIGFLIFIHEAGHFLAARKCGVRVEIFSLGFGPALYSWTRGATEYRISAIPIGGFVKMAGAEFGEGTGEPDELNSKSVSARFFIFSAGVIMNALFAFVLFPILFMVGLPFLDPVIGPAGPEKGGPAWEAGLRGGDRILAVGDREIMQFAEAMNAAALGGGDPIPFRVERDGREITTTVEPEWDAGFSFFRTRMGSPALESIHPTLAVEKGGPAHAAGIRDGDRLIGYQGQRVETWEDYLALDQTWRQPGEVQVLVERDEGGEARELNLTVPLEESSDGRWMIGVAPQSNFLIETRLVGLLENPEWAQSLRRLPEHSELFEVNGHPTCTLEEITAALREHLVDEPDDDGGERRMRHVLRWRDPSGSELSPIELVFPAEIGPQLRRDLLDCLFLSSIPSRAAIAIAPGGPADRAGVRNGDTLIELDGVSDLARYAREQDLEMWAAIVQRIGEFTKRDAAERNAGIRMKLRRIDGEIIDLLVVPERRIEFPFTARHQFREYIMRENNLLSACAIGFRSSIDMFGDVYLTLKRMIFGKVGAKNLMGVVGISHISYEQTKSGLAKFLFFLGLLSINLAFINILPIPILDGGHLFFLLVEKIKGSPVNERVLGYSQMVGLLLILFLLIYVTFNDIQRLIT